MGAKTAAYVITTADDTEVYTRTEGKAANKLADKLTAETGQAHRVYTPTGKLRYEAATEAVEAPAEDAPEVDTAEVIEEVLAEVASETPQETENEAAEAVAKEPTVEPAEAAQETTEGFISYATLMDLLNNDDDAVRTNAATEWSFRLEVYKKRTNAKDQAKRIVGPAMAAALERGETTDGRTVSSLAKRGLVERGDGLAFTVTEAGKAALTAAVEAVTI